MTSLISKPIDSDIVVDPFTPKVAVIGPNRVENLNSVMGVYSGTETTYAWPTSENIDMADVSVYAVQGQAEYYSGGGSVINSTTIDTDINLAEISFRGAIVPRHPALYDRDCQVGDIVTVFYGNSSFTTTVAGLDGDIAPSSISSAAPDNNNAPAIETDSATWERTGPNNGVDILSVDASQYNGAEFGAIQTTYVIRVITGGHPNDARLRVYNTHGDEETNVQISNWRVPTPIGRRGLTVTFRSPWANSDHPYRRKITVQTDNLDTDLENFPVYVYLPYSIHEGKVLTQYDPDQGRYVPMVHFYDANGQEVPYEFEGFNTLSANRWEFHFWVRLSLKKNPSGNDNTVWIYYGGNTRQVEAPATVFDGYDLVTHMWETDPSYVNSSVGPRGSKKDMDEPLGIVHSSRLCQEFDQEDYDDYVNFTNTVGGYTSGNFTIEAWAKIPRRADNEYIIGRQRVFGIYDPNDPLGGWFVLAERYGGSGTPRKLFFYFREVGKGYGNYVHTVWDVWPDNQWFHFAIVRTGSTINIFINGVAQEVVQYANAETLGVPVRPLFVGKDNMDVYQFGGWIDEVRLSPTNRSAEWLKFEVANMSSPDNELTWGAEEHISEFEESAGFLVGQMWWITIRKSFTPPTATSGGNYRGQQDRSYVVVVTKGGNNPEIQCYSRDGTDSSGPTSVVANLPIPVGSYGATITFNRLPLCKNDKYYFTAYAPAVSRINRIILSDVLPWSTFNSLSLRIPGTYALQHKDFFASSTGLKVKSNITVTHPTYRNGSVLVPLPLRKATIVSNFYTISSQYVNSVTKLSSLNDLSQIPGELHPSNPLKFAAYAALSHSSGSPVYIVGVGNPYSISSWAGALEAVATRGMSLASLVPTTNQSDVLDEILDIVTTDYRFAYRSVWIPCSKDLPYYLRTNIPVTISQTAPGVYTTITALEGTPFSVVRVGDTVRIAVDNGFYIDTVAEVVSSTVIKTTHGYTRAVTTSVPCFVLRTLISESDIQSAYSSMADRYASEKMRLVYTDNVNWSSYKGYYSIPAILASLRSSIYPQAPLYGPVYGCEIFHSNVASFHDLGLIALHERDDGVVIYRGVVPVKINGVPKDETPINIRDYIYRRIWTIVNNNTQIFENWGGNRTLYMKGIISAELDNMVFMTHPRYGRLLNSYVINNITYGQNGWVIDLTLNISLPSQQVHLIIS